MRNDQRPVAGRGLDVYPECLLVSSNCPGTLKVAEVHEGWEDIQVHMSSIWPVQCPLHIYETSMSSHGILAEAKSAINHLPGQPTDYTSVQGRVATANTTARVLGLYHQQSKVTAESISTDPVLGISSGLQGNEILPSEGESSGHSSDLSRGSDSGQIVNPAAITVDGQVECSIPGSIVSPSLLSPVATVKDPVTQKVEVI